MPPSTFRYRFAPIQVLAMGLAGFPTLAEGATPEGLLATYSARAGMPADVRRGEVFFNSSHGRDWRCSSCHGATPVSDGRHVATGKPIQPLAPGGNPVRFKDADKVEKWFRRNCADVVGRACSDGEKADILAWLITLKR